MHTLAHFARILAWCQLLALNTLAINGVMASNDITRGSLLSRDELGEVMEIPLVSTDVSIEINGPIARTVVTQQFHNPDDRWMEALYLFPLPQDAAVDRMRLEVGDRIIEGQIQEREAAKATYQQAKAEGKRAALVEQDRPNLFNTSVANIPPRGSVSVRIEYQQSLAWRDGEFSLRFPLAITPRYNANLPDPTFLLESTSTLSGGWSILPGERPNQLPLDGTGSDSAAEAQPVSIRVTLRAGFDLAEVSSHYHKVTQQKGEDGSVQIALSEEQVPADRDFLLSWKPVPAQQPTAALFAEAGESGNFGLLMLTPPTLEGWKQPAREVIFVIDTSGSMAGQSIRAARQALLAGIEGLKPEDRFNIIEFNSTTTQLYRGAQPADPSNLREAKRYIRKLQADGGTNMVPALDLALATDHDRDAQRLRQIVFITDGAVSTESALFAQINRQLGQSRLFTVGIGSAPNSFFMEEAAVAGRGTFTYIATPDGAEQTMKALFAKLAQPVLTQIEVRGEGVSDITPAIVPDLYAGEPMVVAMKLQPGMKRLVLQGQMGDTLWKQTLEIDAMEQRAGIGIDWARRMINQWLRAGTRGASPERIKQQITELALDFHLVSPYTSLVAVDVTPVRPASETLESNAIPANKPQGLEVKQLIPMAQGATGYQATLMIGLVLLLVSLLLTKGLGRQQAYGEEYGERAV